MPVLVTSKTKKKNKDHWRTPPEIYDRLHAEFHFTIDAAAEPHNAKCDRFYTKEDNGLKQRYGTETVWCNPPYSRGQIVRWARKAYKSSRNGALWVLLVPASVDTGWCHDWVFGKAEVRFPRGRVRFLKPSGKRGKTPNFASMICVFWPPGRGLK